MSSDNTSRPSPQSFAGAWVDASAHILNGALKANSALVSLLGSGDDSGTESLTYRDDAWRTEVDVAGEDPTVGDRVTFTKRLEEEDVRAFAAASGDTNRLHLDDEYAEDTRFQGRIVHGTLVGGLISAALARLPGLTVYLSQELSFVGPVEVGEDVTATVEVVEDLADGRLRLSTVVTGEDGEEAVTGEAVVLSDDAPESAPADD
jgi:3-hydroxybutyryl-CoA dehydratase